MAKSLYIAEKPSVAQEFAKALKISAARKDGYMESEEAVVTWCVGHLVTMSYPERYNPTYKKWTLAALPFLPKKFIYEVIPGVSKQFQTVKGLLNREDIETIYVCTDSGREGEYIYRLVEAQAGVPQTKVRRRVWIDSQTEEEILRGIKEAKLLSEYDNLSDAAYLRAKEDYLMGINFSRVLTLKYGQTLQHYLKTQKWSAISVGRVMTCVLGMVVRREREIRDFVKTPFYRVLSKMKVGNHTIEGEWRAVEGSKYFVSPLLYKENGWRDKASAERLLEELGQPEPRVALVEKIEKKKEVKNPPLLYNLAELQNDCSRLFKISPDKTLSVVQELYEKKLVTYPRTDARVLSTAVAKEIHKNISGLRGLDVLNETANAILQSRTYQNIAKSRYVNDKQITDHYAIIPTGQGIGGMNGLSTLSQQVYTLIARRFLSIFLSAAVYQKLALVTSRNGEKFFTNFKVLQEPGYLKIASNKTEQDTTEDSFDAGLLNALEELKKGKELPISELTIKEGETAPPKRYNSGTLILAMENAGQLIEDEELRAQIKGSGIGTSATRAEILNKLVKIQYLNLNQKTQVVTPNQLGELVYEVVNASIKSLLNPDLTASWEKGLNYVAEGAITEVEYMEKLEGFVERLINGVKGLNNQSVLWKQFEEFSMYYKRSV